MTLVELLSITFTCSIWSGTTSITGIVVAACRGLVNTW